MHIVAFSSIIISLEDHGATVAVARLISLWQISVHIMISHNTWMHYEHSLPKLDCSRWSKEWIPSHQTSELHWHGGMCDKYERYVAQYLSIHGQNIFVYTFLIMLWWEGLIKPVLTFWHGWVFTRHRKLLNNFRQTRRQTMRAPILMEAEYH